MDLDLTVRAFQRRRIANPIEVARDGQEAIEFIARWEAGTVTPALILLDLKLPKIDGIEVLLHFKQHPTYRTIPIVVLTQDLSNKDDSVSERHGRLRGVEMLGAFE